MPSHKCARVIVAVLAVVSYILLTIAGFGPKSIPWVVAETTDAPLSTKISVRRVEVCWEFGDHFDKCEDYMGFRRQFSTPSIRRPERSLQMTQNIKATLGALITLQVLTLPSWALTITLFSSSFLGYTIAAFFAPVLMAIVMLAMVMSSNAMQGDEWSRVISNKQWKWDAAPGPAVYLTLMPLVFVALIVLGSFVVLCFGKLCGSSNRGSSSHHSSSSPASRNRPWRSKHTPTTPPHERRAPTSSSAQPATNANNNVTSVSGRHAGDAGLYGSSQPSNPHGQPPNPYGQPANPYGAAPAPAYGQPSAPAHGFSGPWMCSTCTLSNPASAQQCTMCTSARPAPSAYPTAPDPNRSALI